MKKNNCLKSAYWLYSFLFVGISLGLCFNIKAQVPGFSWAKQAKGLYSSSNDIAYAIATDADGNSYVTGSYQSSIVFGNTLLSSSGNTDVFTMKYDSSGTVLWAVKGGGSSADNSYAIAVDSAGNSYITGSFQGTATFGSTTLTSSGGTDIFTVKYDAAGTVLWAVKGGSTTGMITENGYGIAIDGAGNCYVTGSFLGSATFGSTTLASSGNTDVFTVKYDASGTVVWAVKGGGTSGDFGYAVAVDSASNSYITGYFQGTVTFGSTTLTSSGGQDAFIVKYDPSGVLLWAKKGGGTGTENGYGIAVDCDGNSYVTGRFSGSATFGSTTLASSSGSQDVFIVKYDASGTVVWAKKAGGTGIDNGQSIVVDSVGNSYVTGSFSGSATFGSTTIASSGDTDIFTVKYDASGTVVWAKKGGGAGTDNGQDIALDGNGNVYVAGYFNSTATFGSTTFTSSGSADIFTVKYDASGAMNWALQKGGVANDYARAIATDVNGNSYVTGYFSGSAAFGTTTLISNGSSDIFIAKYDASGTVLWAVKAGGTGADNGYGIALDASGNSYITGYFNGSANFGSITLTSSGGQDIFTAKYDASGTVIWAVKGGGTAQYEYSYGIAVDANGNSYITGNCGSNASFGSTTFSSAGAFIVKYNASGTVMWADKGSISPFSVGSMSGKSIALDVSGNSYVTGYFGGNATFGSATLSSNGGEDVFIIKYDPSGVLQWALTGGGIGSDSGNGITVDGAGNSYVTGEFGSSATFGHITLSGGGMFTAKYDASGGVLWVVSTVGLSSVSGNAIAIDNVGNSYVTGFFQGSRTFGTTTLTSNGFSDVFTVKYDTLGSVIWALSAGGANSENSYGIAVDSAGNRYIAGTLGRSNNVNFGNITLASQGAEMFIAKILRDNREPVNISLSDTTVNENVAANFTVGSFSTTDPDAGNTFTYALVAGTGDTDNGDFNISNNELRITNSPDYEIKNVYSIRVKTTDQGGLTFEKAFTITVNDLNDSISWRGTVSTDWNDGDNWSGGAIPANNIDVYVSAGLLNYPIITDSAACKNLTIDIGATVVVDSGAYLSIYGNFINNGTFTHLGGTVSFASLARTQQVPALNYYNLAISGNSSTKVLQGNVTVNGNLSFTDGVLDGNGFALNLNGGVLGETTTSYFKGNLTKTIPVSGVGSHNFGNIGLTFDNVGGGNWGNVTITRTTGSFVTNAQNNSQKSISRRWNIEPDTQVGTPVNLTLSWLATENNELVFPNNEGQVWKSEDNGQSWLMAGPLALITSNGDLRSVTVQTSSFSLWTVTDQNNPLPVSWLYFKGKSTKTGNQLNWATASEKNSSHFAVERSLDARNFEKIGEVKAAGNSNQQLQYTFLDKNAIVLGLKTTYYRLKQVDLDGSYNYTTIVLVNRSKEEAAISVYPNPFQDMLTLQLAAGNTIVELVSLAGKTVWRKEVKVNSNDQKVDFMMPYQLAPGMYLLRVLQQDKLITFKVTKK